MPSGDYDGGMADTARAEGLRERKKRQTRQHISDVATGLFLERGFDAVTIAEIAEAAEVSVNTVYNYFPAKEELFFDREDALVHQMSELVRARRPGESAAGAVLRHLREELGACSSALGLVEGFDRFMKVVFGSPALMASLWRAQQLATDELARTLAAETGAAPGDPLPELVAGQIGWLRGYVHRRVGAAMAAGGKPQQVAREVLAALDGMEEVLGERVLGYAVRPAPSTGDTADGTTR
jgi:AcrR family transcriptional regulator